MLGSPSLARPVSGLGLRAGIGAVMTSAKRLPASRVALLDGHIGVAEADDLYLGACLNIDGRLLRAAGGAERLVERNFTTLVGSHKQY